MNAEKRGKLPALCLYCGSAADSRDHVPPKCLLERPFPPNLTWVPACRSCNQGASLDEEYLLTILAQIGTSVALTDKIEPGGVVDRALDRSPTFAASIERSLVPHDGRVMIQVDQRRLEKVAKKIAIGLLYLRYGAVPLAEEISGVNCAPYNIQDLRGAASFIATYTERFRSKRWTRIQHGVFSYIVVRGPSGYICIIDMHQTMWAEVHLRRLPRRGRVARRQFDLDLR
jgi:hypothetical protein